jgi:uncharacterized protein YecE (DUF72 family)
MELHVGCAQWRHAAWQSRDLRSYATWCNAVEGNTTFYATPSQRTVRSWAEQTGEGFRFLLKLPKAITHERRLVAAGQAMRDFLAVTEPLAERTLWVQLPASFGPDELPVLADFLDHLPRDHRYAVEVRHPAFFTEESWGRRLEEVLGEVAAEWATFDTTVLFASSPTSQAEREAQARKPRLPRRDRALTRRPVVRYIGRDDPERTAEGWRPWRDTVVGWLREGRSPTVFIHTPDNAEALVLARRFHKDVRALVPELKPLPDRGPANDPLTLF